MKIDVTFKEIDVLEVGFDGYIQADKAMLIPLTVTENGEYVPEQADGYSKVTVDIPEKPVVLEPVTIVENGVYTPATADGYSVVTVEVPSGGGIKGGYNVTFTVDGTEYAFASVIPGQAISAPATNPTIEGKIFTGWYLGDEQVEFPYTPTEDATMTAAFSETIILGFTGLTNKSGTLTLTDDVGGFAGWQTTVVGADTIVTNPLDDVFPYNAIEEFTDDSGNVFVKYPKFYMKWVLDSSGNIDGWKISNQKVDDTYFLNDAFLSPTGAENDYFALGKYEMSGSSSKGYSKSGQTCLVSITRENARAAARAYGDSSNYYNGYQQEDIAQFTVYNFLCMMYYRTANIQTVYGGRTGMISSWDSAASTGSCDGVTGLNGWNSTTECVKMLGIENPYGNIWKWIDGIYFSGTTIYTHRFPQYYAESTTNAEKWSWTRLSSSGWIKTLKAGTTIATRSGVYFSETGGSASTYVGDNGYYEFSGVVLFVGGHWEYTSGAGLWQLYGNTSAPYADSSVGARLSYRPL